MPLSLTNAGRSQQDAVTRLRKIQFGYPEPEAPAPATPGRIEIVHQTPKGDRIEVIYQDSILDRSCFILTERSAMRRLCILLGCGTPQHGLPSALITSDYGTMRSLSIKWP